MDAKCHSLPCTGIAADGSVVRLRELDGGDGPRLVELFGCLSPESIYNRFLAPIARLDEAQVMTLTHTDPATERTVAAFLEVGRRERLVGVGRFRRVSEDAAEVAIVVGDPWQRQGIGRMIVRAMGVAAREFGLKWFDATIDPCNVRLLRFAESCGFRGTLQYREGLLRMRTPVAEDLTTSARPP